MYAMILAGKTERKKSLGIMEEQGGQVWTRFIWLGIRISGGLL
jgi:hypothetical protein